MVCLPSWATDKSMAWFRYCRRRPVLTCSTRSGGRNGRPVAVSGACVSGPVRLSDRSRQCRVTNRREAVAEWTVMPVPAVQPCQSWPLSGLRQLITVRRAVRTYLSDKADSEDAVGRTILVMDELASNALRHGTAPACVMLCEHHAGWLIIASDAAPHRLPRPARNRPAEQGGMGLYVISDLSLAHGVQRDSTLKQVWAVVGRD